MVLITCKASAIWADQGSSPIKLSILSAEASLHEDEITVSFRMSLAADEDYCELHQIFKNKSYSQPYDFFSADIAGQILDYKLPQFSDSPLEADEYVFERIPAETDRIETYGTWTDALPEDKAQLPKEQMRIGRLLFPCSEVEQAKVPQRFLVSDAASVDKVKRIFKKAKRRMVYSPWVNLSLAKQ
jgi:hypothetical protein